MINPETFAFLADLKEHNVKEWFDENRGRYKKARENVLEATDNMIEGIIEFDPTLQGLQPKNCLFRINRDVRFSNNKDPYKTNFGISMASGGKKSGLAGYYVNIEPTSCFVGGGFYMPPSPTLKKIRAHIDIHGEKLQEILDSSSFQQVFAEMDEGPTLKTAPKGYPKDHPHVNLLRKKSFTAIKNISPETLQGDDMLQQILPIFQAMHPMIQFLNEAIENNE